MKLIETQTRPGERYCCQGPNHEGDVTIRVNPTQPVYGGIAVIPGEGDVFADVEGTPFQDYYCGTCAWLLNVRLGVPMERRKP